MNTTQRIAAATAVVAMGLTATACGGSSGGGDDSAGTDHGAGAAASPADADSATSGEDTGGELGSCDTFTALVAKDLGVTGRVKKTSDPSSDLHCNYGYKNALHPGTAVEVWTGGAAGTDMLKANEKHMVNPTDVPGVGDAAFVSDAGAGQHVLGAAEGDTMVIIIGPGTTDRLGTFAGDLLAQVG